MVVVTEGCHEGPCVNSAASRPDSAAARSALRVSARLGCHTQHLGEVEVCFDCFSEVDFRMSRSALPSAHLSPCVVFSFRTPGPALCYNEVRVLSLLVSALPESTCFSGLAMMPSLSNDYQLALAPLAYLRITPKFQHSSAPSGPPHLSVLPSLPSPPLLPRAALPLSSPDAPPHPPRSGTQRTAGRGSSPSRASLPRRPRRSAGPRYVLYIYIYVVIHVCIYIYIYTYMCSYI